MGSTTSGTGNTHNCLHCDCQWCGTFISFWYDFIFYYFFAPWTLARHSAWSNLGWGWRKSGIPGMAFSWCVASLLEDKSRSLRLVKLYGQENTTCTLSQCREAASLKMKGLLYSCLLTTRLPSERRIHLEIKPPFVLLYWLCCKAGVGSHAPTPQAHLVIHRHPNVQEVHQGQ